ncbi:MAG: TonB-dependent receptor [Burkholderiaceae bacterium]
MALPTPASPAPGIATLALLGLVTLGASPQAAHGKDALPEVSVTARGYATPTVSTPQAIEVLEAGVATTGPAGSLMRGEPGLAVQSDGAWGQNPVLRGLKKESIGILVDGVRVNSAQPQGAIASFLDAGLLERAEVVKGPSSVLYGSGAMGGAVNLLTPRLRFADDPTHGGRVSLTGSTVDKGFAGAGIYRYASPRHALVLGVAGRDLDDYRGADGRVPRTGYQSDSLLLKYGYRTEGGTVWRANLQRHADHDVWYPGSARTGGQPGGAGIAPPLGRVTIHSPEQRRELIELGVDTRIGVGKLSVDIYRQDVFRQIRARSDALGRDYVRNDVTFETDGVKLRYLVPVGERHLLTLGAEHWRMSANPTRFMDNNPPLFDNNMRNDPFRNGRMESTGAYIQDEISFGDTLVVAALRYDRVVGDADQKGVGPAAQTTGLRHTDDTIAWSIGASHAISPALNPYINLGSAYRAADMRERFEDSARGDGYFHVGNPDLEPERSISIELGLKGDTPALGYRIAIFHTRIDDYIAGRVTGATHPQNGLPIKQTENLDKVSIHGVEGGASKPFGSWLADASFTWLRGRNHQDDEPLTEMPPPEIRLGIGQPSERGFGWRAQLRAVAAQKRIATRFTNGAEDRTPSFITADLAFGWKFGRLGGFADSALDVRLTNLFDKGYHEHLAQGLSGQEIQAPGRGLVVTLSGGF